MDRMSRGDRGEASGCGLVVVLVLVGIFWLICYGSTSSNKAIHAAEDIGYTNVVVVDKSPVLFFGPCSDSDDAKFIVQGTDPRGQLRTITVCAGIFKGGTVRSR